MRYLFFVLFCAFCFSQTQQEVQKGEQKSQMSQEDKSADAKSPESLQTSTMQMDPVHVDPHGKESRFSPAQASSPYYASFGVNFAYVNFHHQKFFDLSSANTLLFALDMGWLQGRDRDLVLGLYLDGATGSGKNNSLYGMFGGLKLGGRLCGGRVTLFGKLGMGFTHFPFEYREKQVNAYGLDTEAGLFVDVAKGMGINLSYRYGYSYAYHIKVRRIHTSVVMLGFAYYDLGLDW